VLIAAPSGLTNFPSVDQQVPEALVRVMPGHHHQQVGLPHPLNLFLTRGGRAHGYLSAIVACR